MRAGLRPTPGVCDESSPPAKPWRKWRPDAGFARFGCAFVLLGLAVLAVVSLSRGAARVLDSIGRAEAARKELAALAASEAAADRDQAALRDRIARLEAAGFGRTGAAQRRKPDLAERGAMIKEALAREGLGASSCRAVGEGTAESLEFVVKSAPLGFLRFLRRAEEAAGPAAIGFLSIRADVDSGILDAVFRISGDAR